MNRIALLALLWCMATQALAQTERPYFYLWDAPATATYGSITAHASQMIYVNGFAEPEFVASQAASRMAAQIAAGLTDPAHVCISFNGLGEWRMAEPGDDPPVQAEWSTSIIRAEDTVAPAWVGGVPPQDTPEWAHYQPWMTHGVEFLKSWMEDFVAELDSLCQAQGLPVPARFHLDSEIYIWSCCSPNLVRVMEAVAGKTGPLDNRWNTELVPGYGKTMADLYAEAVAKYGWPNVSLTTALDENDPAGTFAPQNRPYTLWYAAICQGAVDGALKEAVYDVVTSFVSSDPSRDWSTVKCSNFEHTNTDGRMETFGWHTGRTAPLVPGNNAWGPTRDGARAFQFHALQGTAYIWGDYVDPVSGVRSVWGMTPNRASGQFSGPVLYPVTTDHFTSTFRNYYLYGHPQISGHDAWMFHARRWVESIIETEATGTNSPNIAPWMAPPLTTGLGQPVTQADVRGLLGMLRAKRVPEVCIWTDSIGHDPEWEAFLENIHQVFRPDLFAYRVRAASIVHPSVSEPSRLWYTFAEQDMSDDQETQQTVTARSRVVGQSHEVDIEFRFRNVDGPTLSRMILNLECSVSHDPADPDHLGLRGHVYVLMPDGHTWEQQAEVMDNNIPGFAFYTPPHPAWRPRWDPPNPALPSEFADMHETRRSWIINRHLVNSSEMVVKIALRRASDFGPFDAQFDLVQLVGAPDVVCSCGETENQGADYDYSQSVTLHDLNAFTADYAAGQAAADFNNDGQINALDVSAFTQAFQNP